MSKKSTSTGNGIFGWQAGTALILLLLSSIGYIIHFLIFRDGKQILLYFIGDLAFLPIQVLLVTLFLNRLLDARDKKDKLKKMNMAIGAFFSEVGNELISFIITADRATAHVSRINEFLKSWDAKEFSRILSAIRSTGHNVSLEPAGFAQLKEKLLPKRDFLLSLLQNPNLLEHDGFTDLLWAVFHLAEELTYRKDFRKSAAADINHLNGDTVRAQAKLTEEWFLYMDHLRKDYPYLFSLAARMNPFDPGAKPEVI